MKTNQLLLLGLKKLAVCFIAGLFGFVAMKSYMNVSAELLFDVDESIVGESFIDESGNIITIDNGDKYAKTGFIPIIDANVYTREILKESGMNSIDVFMEGNEFHIATVKTQKVINLAVFRPPRTRPPRSDILNTS